MNMSNLISSNLHTKEEFNKPLHREKRESKEKGFYFDLLKHL